MESPNQNRPQVGTLLSDVEPETVHWLWGGRIPLGKLTVLDGDPGEGKSVLMLDIAARVSTGKGMPDGS
jgi:archaellum biogenesis ATPase FlaH